MLNHDPERERAATAARGHAGGLLEPSVHGEGLAAFRRAYRWLNLTLVQQGLWPLLVVVLGAPSGPVWLTPSPWYWARLGAPLLAALLAAGYLWQRPEGAARDVAMQDGRGGSERDKRLREQAAILIVGVAAAVAALRLLHGPLVPVLKLVGFGLADVAAYHVINFGVAARGLSPGIGQVAPVALFALSWGMGDAFLTAASPASESLPLAFAGGAAIGLGVGAVSTLLRGWPGGNLPAAAFQFLAVYLVLGYLR